MPTATRKRVDAAHSSSEARGPRPELDAIGSTALAKSQKADAQRNLLTPGLHNVALTVDGTIDKKPWSRQINGSLVISPDSGPVASSSTPWEKLLESALCWLSQKERQTWLATLAKGEIPPTACSEEKAAAVAAEMEPALKAYRATKTAPKRGTVSFVATAAE